MSKYDRLKMKEYRHTPKGREATNKAHKRWYRKSHPNVGEGIIHNLSKSQVLAVIEAISMDDLVLEVEMLLEDSNLSLRMDKDKIIQSFVSKLSTIYKYAHVAQKPKCIKSHLDWVDEFNECYKAFKKDNII